ncbi:rubredoxin [Actinomadura rugatobispora]|uniref:Rubredoxin n=1 Tax=Actinomadura rugatobispora TaxID=1994 RepID=A0ABW1A2I8_9ACTN|nr:rubredoxin [Actinomadura rugatobispora]
MTAPGMAQSAVKGKAWMCLVCGFVYYEDEGLPDEGIPPGTSWDDIPDDWACPDCGVSKEDFVMAPF